MIKKSITLEGVSLVDFLGVGNEHINALVVAFPGSKIISRGNTITIWGNESDIDQIIDILNALIGHFHQFGRLTAETVNHCIAKEETTITPVQQGLLFYGNGGIPIKTRTKNQQKLVDVFEAKDLVFVLGPAGTGKTYVSVALAVRAFKKKQLKKIILTRPVVEAGENLGFLPGDLKAKVDPYLRPIYDILRDTMSIEKMEYYIDREIIEIAPLAYMRGRTLDNAFILLDEAQNTTPMQMRMALTRIGPNAKMIVTGDASQVDLPPGQRSGLNDAVEKLRGIEGVGFVQLTERDVIRHRLVKDIIAAYRCEKRP